LKTCGDTIPAFGTGQLEPDRRGLEPGDDQEDEPARDVHDAEALVVDGRDPRVQPAEERELGWPFDRRVVLEGRHARR
jgi:hypothetical protein